MNTHPVILLEPVLHWLDRIIRDYGLYIYMVFVWLSPFLIAWILSGGFWRRSFRQRPVAGVQIIVIQPTAKPPPLPPAISRESGPTSNDDQSFAV